MASPTTTIFAAAILWSRFSIRSRVIIWTWGVWRVTCGVAMKSRSRCDARIDTPHAARPTFCSRYPPLFLGPPLECDAPHPPRFRDSAHVPRVRDPMHSSVGRQHPAPVRRMAACRKPERALDHAGEESRRGRIRAHRRMSQVQVSFSLAQERDLGLHE